MISKVEMRVDELLRTLRDIQPEMKKSMDRLVKDAAVITVRRCIAMTPPGGKGITGKAVQKRGEAKIARDIYRVFGTASQAHDSIPDKEVAKAFWKYSRRATTAKRAEKLLHENSSDPRFFNSELVSKINPSLHKSNRNKRTGGISKNQPALQIAISAAKSGPIEKYIKTVQKNVGIWCAGWMQAVIELKVSKIPAWIRRHAGFAAKNGRCVIKPTADGMEITIANSTGFGSLQHIVPGALVSAKFAMIASAKKIKEKAIAKAGLKK